MISIKNISKKYDSLITESFFDFFLSKLKKNITVEECEIEETVFKNYLITGTILNQILCDMYKVSRSNNINKKERLKAVEELMQNASKSILKADQCINQYRISLKNASLRN